MDVVPGNHLTLVLPPGQTLAGGYHRGEEPIFRVVLSRILRFLQRCGTPLWPQAEAQILSNERYMDAYWHLLQKYRSDQNDYHGVLPMKGIHAPGVGNPQVIELPIFAPLWDAHGQRSYVNLHHRTLTQMAQGALPPPLPKCAT